MYMHIYLSVHLTKDITKDIGRTLEAVIYVFNCFKEMKRPVVKLLCK